MTNDVLEGVWPAVTLPFSDTLALDEARLAEHCAWVVESGCEGVVVNGSLGEYEALTDGERAAVVETAVAEIGADRVIPGVAGKSAAEARRWTDHAADLGVPAVMCLPPTSHAPTGAEVIAHYTTVAEVGLPIIAYNNPWSTRIDLTPDILASVASDVKLVVGVKEFSQDVRRVMHILDLMPEFQVICGCDDVLVESVMMGARGWIAGFANAFPEQSVALYDRSSAGDIEGARALYAEMLPILRWDADPRFVQAIKLGQELAGRYGGPTRLPRLPLDDEDVTQIRYDTERALSAGLGPADS
ncbi:dihydrodipicolinate synthase family protein [Euzebya tangerina]|uniref:dihydrodipicolinate synthase family protein n=1 Tax=Euzebya tangerina TaxID=591198 RepID=UPI000E31055C|nr:dihydrodipicolinate synthase family protein [Euzebya tangerina]